jgi:hypothetical protein
MPINPKRLDVAAISEYWHRHLLPNAAPQHEFDAKYLEQVGGERLYEAAIDDASAVVGFYTSTLMQLNRFSEAETELRRLVQHPEFGALESRFRTDAQCKLGFCALAQEREAEALAHFRSLWSGGNAQDRRDVLLTTRHFLPDHLRRPGMASSDLTGFVIELNAHLKGKAPRRKRFPNRTTYRKLRRHIHRSYPRVRYDPGDPIDQRVREASQRAGKFIRRIESDRQAAAAQRKQEALARCQNG